MKAGVIRTENMAVERSRVLRKLAGEHCYVSDVKEILVSAEALTETAFFDELESDLQGLQVLFVAVPSAYAFHLATVALRLGLHTFLGRSASPSISECREIAALGEEAGVEVGISRMMRYHPFWQYVSEEWRVTTISLQHHTIRVQGFKQMLEDAVDLCCSLTDTGEVRGIDAQLVQLDRQHPNCLLVGLRFQNGVYAQIQLRQGTADKRHMIYAGGSFEFELDLMRNTLAIRASKDEENDNGQSAFESHSLMSDTVLSNNEQAENLIALETRAFLAALTNDQPAPITVVDGLQTMRVVEQIRMNLR